MADMTIKRRLTGSAPNSVSNSPLQCACSSRPGPRTRSKSAGSCPMCTCPLCVSCPLCTVAMLALALATPGLAYADSQPDSTDDPCAGLLAVLDRPTAADSVCVVKPGRAVVEMGYSRQTLHDPDPGTGRLRVLPQAELRFGLPHGFEFKLFPPNYNRETTSPPGVGGTQTVTGYGDTGIGLKYQFRDVGRWSFATDALITLPTGNHGFSSGGTGVTLNGIASYSLTPNAGLSGMLGVSSLTGPAADGRTRRYTTLNPDLVAAYQFNDAFQVYAEVYGTTHAAPGAGGAYVADGGLQYLITPHLEIDVEYGTRLSGQPGFSHYVGAGFGVEF